jgi:hypothetical protein
MPNGKHGDNPLSDLAIHGQHPFPSDIEKMLLRIDTLGRRPGRWPLGENWPFSPREFQWERGEDLDGARRDLAHLLSLLEAGRGDEILVDPLTHKPFRSARGPQRAGANPLLHEISVEMRNLKVQPT